MEFPERERVFYEHNPLVEVVCQINFPRILALDENLPAQFQATLGGEYPFIETKQVATFQFDAANAEQSPSSRTHYEFWTEDRKYAIALSSEWVSVRTHEYTKWEDFFIHLERAANALQASYHVPIFTRLGLRYVDAISRNKLGLEDARWSELIRASALGILAEDDVPIADVEDLHATTALKLDGDGKVIIRSGLGRTGSTGDELVFIIDSDFFHEEVIKGSADAFEICRKFNSAAGRAFQWLILGKLHDALKPRSVDG